MKKSLLTLLLVLMIVSFYSANAQSVIGPVYYTQAPYSAEVPDWWYAGNVTLEGWGNRNPGEAAPNERANYYCGNRAFAFAAWAEPPGYFYGYSYGRIYDVTYQDLEIQYNPGGGTPRIVASSLMAKCTYGDQGQSGPQGP